MSWADRLRQALSENSPDAKTVKTVKSPDAPSFGAIGSFDTGTFSETDPATAPANDAPAAPALPTQQAANRESPDPDAEAERGAIEAEPALPEPGSPERERADTEQRGAVAGLLRASLARPTSWADVNAMPGKGAWCRCCQGQRWWTEAKHPHRGWRCAACHPAPGIAIWETRT